jgi:hypothetical protein
MSVSTESSTVVLPGVTITPHRRRPTVPFCQTSRPVSNSNTTDKPTCTPMLGGNTVTGPAVIVTDPNVSVELMPTGDTTLISAASAVPKVTVVSIDAGLAVTDPG